MTRFKELRRFEAALAGSTVTELEWAIEFSNSMLRRLRLKSSVNEWRKRKEQAQARYAEVLSSRRLTSA